MELLQLRYFLDSAQLGSLARTAEKYMVPASSVSAAIRRLEKELGQPLFDRSSNRIVINHNGQKLLKSLETVFSELDQTVNDILYPPDNQIIRLLVLSHRKKVTDHIIEYQQKHPDVTFDTCINYDLDASADYDIIIGPDSDHSPNYEHDALCRCRIYLRANQHHPLYGRELTLLQLRDYPFVTMGGNMHQIIVAACERVGFSPKVIAKVNDIACYNRLLTSSMVIGHIRGNDQDVAKIPCLNVTDFEAYQNICIFYKKNPTGNIKSFLEFIKIKGL